jgi:hypothetical protein
VLESLNVENVSGGLVGSAGFFCKLPTNAVRCAVVKNVLCLFVFLRKFVDRKRKKRMKERYVCFG